jgi:hypothetical protein
VALSTPPMPIGGRQQIATLLEQGVDELSSNGVMFQRYDDSYLQTDERGFHRLGGGKVAWFRDPDGNTFAIEQ